MKKKQRKTRKEKRVPMEETTEKGEFEVKVKKLEGKLEEEQEKTREYLNRLKYLQADFENYRKRVEKEVQEATQRSNEKLIADLIVILDDLESAISAGKTAENKDALVEGIEMVYEKLNGLLEKEGLVRIECVGRPFDPNTQEVLAEVLTKNHQRGTVIEEARKGFMFKGKVLRPSIVRIAREDSAGEKK